MGQTDLVRGQGVRATELIVWKNFLSRRSVWPIPKLGLFSLAHTWIGHVRSGQYPNIGLFRLVYTQSSVGSVWPIPKHRSGSSVPCLVAGLFALAHIQSSVCFVWPIPSRRSVRSGPFPNVGLFRLVHTQASVCLVSSIPNPRSLLINWRSQILLWKAV